MNEPMNELMSEFNQLNVINYWMNQLIKELINWLIIELISELTNYLIHWLFGIDSLAHEVGRIQPTSPHQLT